MPVESKLPALELGKVRQVALKEYGIRFAFGAAISLVAGLVSSSFGSRLGGVLLAFPAILPASLTLIQDKEGTRRADRDAIGAVLGGVGLLVFAGSGEILLRDVEPFVGLIIMFAAWLLVSFALYGLLCFLRPDDCDRNKD